MTWAVRILQPVHPPSAWQFLHCRSHLALLCCCLEVYLRGASSFIRSFPRVRTVLCVSFYLSLVFVGIPFHEVLGPPSLIGLFLPEGLTWGKPSFKFWHWHFGSCWSTLIHSLPVLPPQTTPISFIPLVSTETLAHLLTIWVCAEVWQPRSIHFRSVSWVPVAVSALIGSEL